MSSGASEWASGRTNERSGASEAEASNEVQANEVPSLRDSSTQYAQQELIHLLFDKSEEQRLQFHHLGLVYLGPQPRSALLPLLQDRVTRRAQEDDGGQHGFDQRQSLLPAQIGADSATKTADAATRSSRCRRRE